MLLLLVLLIAVLSCKKEDVSDQTDNELYAMAKSTSGFTTYKKTNTLLNKSNGSGHSEPFLKTRYNSNGALNLDINGKVIIGSNFADGSLIVKELYSDNTTIAKYAILYKKKGHKNADINGWVWGYLNANGEVLEPSANKGAGCISCHSQADHVDYTLMNKYFP